MHKPIVIQRSVLKDGDDWAELQKRARRVSPELSAACNKEVEEAVRRGTETMHLPPEEINKY